MEKDIWCDGNCNNPENDAHFYDDGNNRIYKDKQGQTYTCSKHHYTCVVCDKIVQVG